MSFFIDLGMFKRMPIPFLYVLATGILLGIVIGFKSFIPYLYFGEVKDYEWGRSALPHVINYLFWPFLVPFIYWTFERFRIVRSAPIKDKLITVFMSLLIPFIHEVLTTVIYFEFLQYADMYDFTEETYKYVKVAFPSVYIGRIVEFWIIYGLFAAFDFYKKYKDKQAELSKIEAQLNRTKLAVLKMQLQPHFLFNALNSISSLMDIDVKRAQMVTAKLGDLLRGILEEDQRVRITIEEELNYVKTYLDIEKIRFEDRLEVEYDIATNVESEYVPLLFIQPLVENAIKHGVALTSKPVKIKVSARKLDQDIEIEVTDTGKGQSLTTDEMLTKGIGLSNIKERLNQLYNGNFALTIHTKPDEGFRVTIVLPSNFETNEND